MSNTSLAVIEPAVDLVYTRIDGNLYQFLGESWEEHVQAWINVEQAVTDYRWQQAAIAASVETKYGNGALQKFAQSVGVNQARIYEYRSAYRLYQNSGRPENLDYTHYVLAASLDKNPEASMTAMEAIEHAADNSLSTRAFKRFITEAVAPPLDETIPALLDQPEVVKAWEGYQIATQQLREAAPRIANLLNGYLSEIQYELSVPEQTIKDAIFRLIEDGFDELDQIAQALKKDRMHVTVWLNRMVEASELKRVEKPRVPGARGQARHGYVIL